MGTINIYILTAVLVLVGAAVTFLSYQITKLKDKIVSFDTIHSSQAQIYKESLNQNWDNYKQLYDIFVSMNQMVDMIHKQYKDMLDLYNSQNEIHKKVFEEYTKLVEIHKQILECCKDMDEQYAVTCEQFEQIAKGQDEIYSKILEIYNFCKPISFPCDPDLIDDLEWDPLADDDDDIYWEPDGTIPEIDFIPVEELNYKDRKTKNIDPWYLADDVKYRQIFEHTEENNDSTTDN